MANVTVRKKKLNDGNYSLFLDITGIGIRKKKYLGYKIYGKPKNAEERTHNTRYTALADDAAAKLQLDLRHKEQGLKNLEHQNTDIVEYFREYSESYKKGDQRVVEAAYKRFIEFLKESKYSTIIPGKSLEPIQCIDFGEYLKRKLKGETPRNYYKKFKQMLIRARKEGITNIDTRDCTVHFDIDEDAINKQILEPEEVAALLATPWPHNPTMRRAFIFSLNTGVDFDTVSTLRWSNITALSDKKNRKVIFTRGKSAKQVRIPLNKLATEMLGKPGEPGELIFRLPSWEATVKSLRAWARKAGITKSITYHSARHTFGYILTNEKNVDIGVLQHLLGHKNIKTTRRYSHLKDKTRRNAIDKLC